MRRLAVVGPTFGTYGWRKCGAKLSTYCGSPTDILEILISMCMATEYFGETVLAYMEFHLDSAEYCQAQHK
nr:unnamed protein product [Callosobruchus chinensis]